MTLAALFIEAAATDPLWFFSVVFTVVVSIVLHELGHGAAALWQGDDTPRRTGHMTADPIVHMGWFSVVMLLTVGMAYGLMPVNPSRFRGRYGGAMVAAAGPAVNLLLAMLTLAVLGLWVRAAGFWDAPDVSMFTANSQRVLWTFATTNLALLILNLLPVPPLDGAAILADFSPAYDRWVRTAADPMVFLGALLLVLLLFSATGVGLFGIAQRLGLWVLNPISGQTLILTDG